MNEPAKLVNDVYPIFYEIILEKPKSM